MKKADVFVNGTHAGFLQEIKKGKEYHFSYDANYQGEPVSFTMPLSQKEYRFHQFPPFFEGLLPEGPMLEALLKNNKIDADDYLKQLALVGNELVGFVTVQEAKE